MGTSSDAIARADQRFVPAVVAKKGVDLLAQRIFVSNSTGFGKMCSSFKRKLATKFRGEPRDEDV